MATPTRTTVRNATQFIAHLEPFRTSNPQGGLWGTDIIDSQATGALPSPYAERFSEAVSKGSVVYAVYSYSTPIAWVSAYGVATIPPVKYSVTTSSHQTKARVALHAFGAYPKGE